MSHRLMMVQIDPPNQDTPSMIGRREAGLEDATLSLETIVRGFDNPVRSPSPRPYWTGQDIAYRTYGFWIEAA